MRFAARKNFAQIGEFTQPIHTANSHSQFTQPIHTASHTANSHRQFTQPVHTANSHSKSHNNSHSQFTQQFTQPIHTGNSHSQFTQPIHTGVTQFTLRSHNSHCGRCYPTQRECSCFLPTLRDLGVPRTHKMKSTIDHNAKRKAQFIFVLSHLCQGGGPLNKAIVR